MMIVKSAVSRAQWLPKVLCSTMLVGPFSSTNLIMRKYVRGVLQEVSPKDIRSAHVQVASRSCRS